MRTLTLPAAPTAFYTPSVGCSDEVLVYPEVILYRFDDEHSEMWLYGCERWPCVDDARDALLEDVEALARTYYPRPMIVMLCDDRAVMSLVPQTQEGIRVLNAQGFELFKPKQES